jgi:hypothetical protein
MSTSENVKSSNNARANIFKLDSKRIDTISKTAGVILAFFWIAQYTIDLIRSNNAEKKNETITYIKRFSEGDLLDARMYFLEFWHERDEFARRSIGGEISLQNYEYILIDQIDKNEKFRKNLRKIGYFFDELYQCNMSGLCDTRISNEYFCDHAVGYEHSFLVYLRKFDGNLVGRRLYQGINEVVNQCPDSVDLR